MLITNKRIALTLEHQMAIAFREAWRKDGFILGYIENGPSGFIQNMAVKKNGLLEWESGAVRLTFEDIQASDWVIKYRADGWEFNG